MANQSDLLVTTVMNTAAALLNDPSRTMYTYAKQIPFVNIAGRELKEFFELNNVPVTDTITSTPITVLAGQTSIGYAPTPPVANTPYLPDDFIEPKVVWERLTGVDPYTIMNRVDYLPRYEEGILINQFLVFTWQSQEIRFLAATQINQIKIDYIRNLFPVLTSVSNIGIVNAQTYFEYRTAALCAEFIGENKTRADDLNAFAALGMDRTIGIGTKGRQAINIRHRPFRNSYKRRVYY